MMTYKQGGNKDEKEISADFGRDSDGSNGTGRMWRKNNASGEDAKTAESVEDKKTFTVGFDAEYPPYGYMDENGEYTGFDLELAEAVCKLEGWELVKNRSTGIPKTWNLIPVRLTASGMDLP